MMRIMMINFNVDRFSNIISIAAVIKLEQNEI